MGRPALPSEKRRDIQKMVRMNVAEALQLDYNAAMAGVTVSEYLRRRGLKKRTLPQRQEANRLTAVALIGIGNNLNQMTRHANAGRGLPVRGALEAVLADIKHHLDRLYDPVDQYRRTDL